MCVVDVVGVDSSGCVFVFVAVVNGVDGGGGRGVRVVVGEYDFCGFLQAFGGTRAPAARGG